MMGLIPSVVAERDDVTINIAIEMRKDDLPFPIKTDDRQTDRQRSNDDDFR